MAEIFAGVDEIFFPVPAPENYEFFAIKLGRPTISSFGPFQKLHPLDTNISTCLAANGEQWVATQRAKKRAGNGCPIASARQTQSLGPFRKEFIMSSRGNRSWWVYVFAIVALLGCLWVGWRDFDPNLTQEVVRESIRDTIRTTPRLISQLLVQYVVPVVLAVFLLTELVAKLRSFGGRG
jgi:hypothetical protein